MLGFKSITPGSLGSAVIKPNTSVSLRRILTVATLNGTVLKIWLKRARLTALMMLKLRKMNACAAFEPGPPGRFSEVALLFVLLGIFFNEDVLF